MDRQIEKINPGRGKPEFTPRPPTGGERGEPELYNMMDKKNKKIYAPRPVSCTHRRRRRGRKRRRRERVPGTRRRWRQRRKWGKLH